MCVCSSSFYSQRHAEGVAGEEPSLAGAVGCSPRDHREHPRYRHPLLHGHEGEEMAPPVDKIGPVGLRCAVGGVCLGIGVCTGTCVTG